MTKTISNDSLRNATQHLSFDTRRGMGPPHPESHLTRSIYCETGEALGYAVQVRRMLEGTDGASVADVVVDLLVGIQCLCAAIDAVVAFGRSNEVGEACAASLRLLASLERVGEHAPIHQHPIVLRREWPESRHSRAALVALIDQRNILRMPADQARDGEFSDRALALASLLCGFFPSVGLTATIADVIDQERKAVRAARLRIRGRRTPQRPKRAPP